MSSNIKGSHYTLANNDDNSPHGRPGQDGHSHWQRSTASDSNIPMEFMQPTWDPSTGSFAGFSRDFDQALFP
ncbi:SubName: Full=Uncharacterized protein {ECO:0000313/EMBL:CCA71438.1} [Serendipita indica DSM 11827]|nr:SubName: Full=Uncharacterized protein {ECO:0000313/EMBL:CCA71438.1} [Serendipita indica DSM 11827]